MSDVALLLLFLAIFGAAAGLWIWTTQRRARREREEAIAKLKEALQVRAKARFIRTTARAQRIKEEAELRRVEAMDDGISRKRLEEINRELDRLAMGKVD